MVVVATVEGEVVIKITQDEINNKPNREGNTHKYHESLESRACWPLRKALNAQSAQSDVFL